MSTPKGTIGILTGGGDVPGLNPAIRAITVQELTEESVNRVGRTEAPFFIRPARGRVICPGPSFPRTLPRHMTRTSTTRPSRS